jgi:hypothetical protein
MSKERLLYRCIPSDVFRKAGAKVKTLFPSFQIFFKEKWKDLSKVNNHKGCNNSF